MKKSTNTSDTFCQPFASIIIPLFNNKEGLLKLLDALKSQSYPKELFEIIVVNNGDVIDISKLIIEHNIILLNESLKQGSYFARNKGIKAAKGDIFCFIDSDCIPDENWITKGINSILSSKAHLVGGNVIFNLSHKRTAAEYYDSITNMQAQRNIQKRCVTTTANLFVKREVINKIGFFPEGIGSSVDIYYSSLAVHKGFKLVYSPDTVIFHPARRFKQLMKKAARVGHGKKTIIKFFIKNELNDKVPLRTFRGRSPFEHLNAVIIWKRLKEKDYNINFVKFLLILFISYIYLFIIMINRFLPSKILLKKKKSEIYEK